MKQKRTIMGIIICVIIFIGLAIALSKQNLKNLWVSVKEVNNIIDFNQCYENDFVQVKITKAYETEYNYCENRTRCSKIY